MRPETAGFASRAVRTSLEVLDSWLADPDDHRALALVGPPGIGKSTLLAAFRPHLRGSGKAGGTVVVAASVADATSARHLADHLRSVRRRAEHGARIVALLDDTERLAARDRGAVALLRREHPEVRVVLTAAHDRQFAHVVPCAVAPLAGPAEGTAAGAGPVAASEVARFFLHCLRRRRPAAGFAPAELGALGRLCARSYGIPSDVDALAGLVAVHGMAAVDAAAGQDGPPHRLADLLAELPGEADAAAGAARPVLSADEMAVLTAILTAPGGAGAGMLRHALPHCDIARVTRSLVEAGLVRTGAGLPSDGAGDARTRFAVRVTGVPVASRCAGRPEVPLAAIRQAHAEHLATHVRRMAAGLCGAGQRAVLAEFRDEKPNLLCVVGELLHAGRHRQAVALMVDAVPLLARICGVPDLLPHVLDAVREYAPATPAEDAALQALAVRVLLAAGEQEAAGVCFEALLALRNSRPPSASSVPSGPSPSSGHEDCLALLGVLAAEQPRPDEAVATLAECVRRSVANRDLVRLPEAAAAYFAYLMRGGEFERVESQCRPLLFEATRHGDDFTSGLLLLWCAAAGAASGGGEGGGLRGQVDRALAKLRRLGPDALLAALSAVVDDPRAPAPRHDVSKLALVIGSLGRADWAWTYGAPACPPLLPPLAERFARDTDARAFERWAKAGEEWDLVDLVCHILRGRWSTAPADGGHQAGGGEEFTGTAVEPARLRELSGLTPREAEVASLVADGLTNKQIGTRLHISEWTVINHLRQVMRKLDCGSRVHVANWVRDAGSCVAEAATLAPVSPATG